MAKPSQAMFSVKKAAMATAAAGALFLTGAAPSLAGNWNNWDDMWSNSHSNDYILVSQNHDDDDGCGQDLSDFFVYQQQNPCGGNNLSDFVLFNNHDDDNCGCGGGNTNVGGFFDWDFDDYDHDFDYEVPVFVSPFNNHNSGIQSATVNNSSNTAVNSEINAGSSNTTTVLQDGDGLANAEVNNLADTAVNSEINAAATNDTTIIQSDGSSL